MRVIAVDPGYDRLGVAVLEKQAGIEMVLYSTCITTNKNDSLSSRLYTLGQAFEKILKNEQPTIAALETLYFNKNTTTALGVAAARGIIIFLAQQYGCVVEEFTPQQIKVATTGYGKSDKTAVITMVKKLVKNVPPTALDDEYDAIATGITCLAHHPQNR